MKVAWLPKEEIVLQARKVLSTHETLTGKPVEPPIPVEDIIERSLNLRFSYEDLQEGYGLEGVIGALYVDLRRICVDLSLADEGKEGRLSFTCAHEAGHWVLHRHLIKAATRPGTSRTSSAALGALRSRLNGRPITLQPACSCRRIR